jgi:hypothetical protein
MPPKKKEIDLEHNGKVLNMYERIPKEFLYKADNPNFNLHKLTIPFRMCCVAP